MNGPHPALADGPVYLDYDATTPVDPRVVAAMQPHVATDFGIPSSAHSYATVPALALHTAREQVAALIGEPPGTVFTGSGSEANNLVAHGPERSHVEVCRTAPRVASSSRHAPRQRRWLPVAGRTGLR